LLCPQGAAHPAAVLRRPGGDIPGAHAAATGAAGDAAHPTAPDLAVDVPVELDRSAGTGGGGLRPFLVAGRRRAVLSAVAARPAPHAAAARADRKSTRLNSSHT